MKKITKDILENKISSIKCPNENCFHGKLDLQNKCLICKKNIVINENLEKIKKVQDFKS